MQAFGGKALTTFKLHIAAIHLPDQARSCGATFFCVEYWVERLVQLVKRMIKYRTTAHPEDLFVNTQLLERACKRLRRSKYGKGCESVAEATEAVRASRVSRHMHDEDIEGEAMLLGAPKCLSDSERRQLLPDLDVDDPCLRGLPGFLLDCPALKEHGWPTACEIEDHLHRHRQIIKNLGLKTSGQDEEMGHEAAGCKDDSNEDIYDQVDVVFNKHVRAITGNGDTLSCAQTQSLRRKDNSWCVMEFELPTGVLELRIVHMQYFVKAELRTANGLNIAMDSTIPAKPLRLAVAHIYKCEIAESPGARARDDDLGLPPDMLTVTDVRPEGHSDPNKPFCGTAVVDLKHVWTQMVPSRPVNHVRHFVYAHKTSGRTAAVKH